MADEKIEGDVEGALAANDDGSDIFMGQSLDDLDSTLSGDEEDSNSEESKVSTDEEDTIDSSVETTDDNITTEKEKKSKFSKILNLSKKMKIIIVSSVFTLILVLAAAWYYFYVYQVEEESKKQEKTQKLLKKKEKVVDLSIINTKRLNRKLSVLLEDEKDRIKDTLKEEKKIEKQNDIIVETKKTIIQIAILYKKIDPEFALKLDALNLDIKECRGRNNTKIFAIVPNKNSDLILMKINKLIAKDAFISKQNLLNLCE
jgi:hypothetical protein